MQILCRQNIKIGFGFILSLICLIFIFKNIDLAEMKHALMLYQWQYTFVVIACLAIDYWLRIYRWSLLLRAMSPNISFKDCQAPFMGSIALNNLLPLRLGDVFRSFVFPTSLDISKANSTSTVIFERLVDLLSLIACIIIGVCTQNQFQFPIWVSKAAWLLGTASLIAILGVYFFEKWMIHFLNKIIIYFNISDFTLKILTFISELIECLGRLSKSANLNKIIIISFLIWLFEAAIFYYLLKGFGFNVNLGYALILMSMTTMATLIPSSPGYIGPFHLAAFSLVSLIGYSSSLAASFAVLAHMSLWLPTTLVGGYFLVFNPDLFNSVFNQSKIKTDVLNEKI